MLTTTQTALAVAAMTAITFTCRIAPFLLARGRENSPFLAFVSQTMPLGVMIVLIAYTLGSIQTDPASWAPATAGIAATAGLHLWRRQMAVSLVGGTAMYVLLSLAMGA